MLAIVLIAIFLIVFVLFCDYVNRPPGTHALRKLEGPPPYFLFGHVPYLPSDIGGKSSFLRVKYSLQFMKNKYVFVKYSISSTYAE